MSVVAPPKNPLMDVVKETIKPKKEAFKAGLPQESLEASDS